ncbi:MAG: energy-coupling factor ABC transporter permease, partial [Synergistaceae bacterium]|nr:energy-coupling factor ABC transporter permease [Synergistaceae bacterium]
QMINFTIPATGSSGHIGGGILLAAMLGPHAAFLTLAVVLAIQCLFFADGGLLALGCNIFNMGFYACFIAYPYIFKPIVRKRPGAKSIAVASAASATAGLLLGAFSVVLETLASGITELPFSAFITLMLPIHLAIGIGEGIITGAVLCFVLQMRPELLDFSGIGETNAENQGLLSFKKTLATLLVLAALVSGGLSLFASAYPDGLEWSMEKVAGTSELERDGGAYKAASEIQEATAFMPDYDFKSAGEEGSAFGTGTAGIVGGALTLGVACAVGAILNASIKRKEKNAAA